MVSTEGKKGYTNLVSQEGLIQIISKVWVKCREIIRFMPILGLLPLLGLKRQDEEEMTFIKKKEILYRK